jgi:phage terminase large subunit-like protein
MAAPSARSGAISSKGRGGGKRLDERQLVRAARQHAAQVLEQATARYRGDRRFVFDEAAAKAACDFFPTYLRHSKGKLAGQPFKLEPWQTDMVRAIFGWKWKDSGLRVILEVLLWIARKNGKSTFAAGLAILMLVADGEAGAEVYSAAADKEQARIVFAEAIRMVAKSSALSDVTESFKDAVLCPHLESVYRVLSADAETKHGLNPNAIINDELHAMQSRDLVDVLHTGIGVREQPLEVHLTTADQKRVGSICSEKYDYAKAVLSGVIDDPTFLPVIFEAEEPPDVEEGAIWWANPLAWVKANPSLGSAVRLQYLAKECQRAQELPSYENIFKRLHLNIRTEQATRWLPIDVWDACVGDIPWQDMEAEMEGSECWDGLDLSLTTDITAQIKLYPPVDADPLWRVSCRFWVPELAVPKRVKRDRVPYDQWAAMGALLTTPGNSVDYRAIKTSVLDGVLSTSVREVGYDPWNAQQLATELLDEGVTMVPVRQGTASMSEPSRKLETLLLDKKIAHGGHPILRWMAMNVAILTDSNGNIKPDKAHSGERIDGIVALIIALSRAIVAEPAKESISDVIERRGGML